jgi:hypothetical protein
MNIFVESIKYIVIHCSATPPNMNIGVDEIDKWHKDRGWSKIGYHIVIRRYPGALGGLIEYGDRTLLEPGAHVYGYNSKSIGICMIGGVDEFNIPQNNFTDDQFEALRKTINFLNSVFPNAIIQGHKDFPNVHKDCPCFDVKDWLIHKEDKHERRIYISKTIRPGIL